jgi:transposase
MVQRMTSPGGPSAMDLGEEVGVPHQTLSRWRKEASSLGDMGKNKKPPHPERASRSSTQWTPEEKLRVVAAASQLEDEQLGEFLRREGLHAAQLEQWRAEVLAALGAVRRPADGTAKVVRELERELARKEKALAEVTALLVLRKKAEALFGVADEEGSSTDEKYGKK